jgi:hypothetical protein
MAIFNSDEAEGKWEQAKGTVKDKVGELTGTKGLRPKAKLRMRAVRRRRAGANSNAVFQMRGFGR